MQPFLSLEDLISLIKTTSPSLHTGNFKSDTVGELWRLAKSDVWTQDHFARTQQVTKSIDIKGELSSAFESGKPMRSGESLEESRAWKLAYIVIFKAMLFEEAGVSGRPKRLKWINRLFKTIDYLDLEPATLGLVQNDLRARLCAEIGTFVGTLDIPLNDIPAGPRMSEAQTIPLTVLFYEGPIARAYLATFRHLNLKPEKIINLVSAADLATQKPVGRWLPKSLRMNYAAHRQRSMIDFWPKRLRQTAKDAVALTFAKINQSFCFPEIILQEAQDFTNLSVYSDNIHSLMITSLNDIALENYLQEIGSSVLLYTGGGLVPSKLLGLKHLKFLHIHPGYLPDIRGADCSLWSIILRGHFSASCFYMKPSIDTGDIIARGWLPPINVALPETLDLKGKYRFVYAFLDPWVRAYILRKVVLENKNFHNMKALPQNVDEGITYNFMHSEIQRTVLNQALKYSRHK